MFEKALVGDRRYWGLIIVLLTTIGVGFIIYIWQLKVGLKITGMSRDVSWGFYIAQFTYLVGIAASAVMVVLPYYLHNYKAFARITILGEFLAVAAVTMCGLFIFVDLGKPVRFLNILLHPTLNSVMFWDMIVLNMYLFLNIVIGWGVPVLAIVIFIICASMVLFFFQTKEMSKKAISHIQNMQDTTKKASELQKHIINQYKQQESFIEKLEENTHEPK